MSEPLETWTMAQLRHRRMAIDAEISRRTTSAVETLAQLLQVELTRTVARSTAALIVDRAPEVAAILAGGDLVRLKA